MIYFLLDPTENTEQELHMLIVPAITILDGKCVSLQQGNYGSVKEYDKDPASLAKEFEDAGVSRVHIVDLNAARGEGQKNRKKLIRIRRTVSCDLEFRGGIREEEDVENLLDLGMNNLVAGTAFARSTNKVAGWIQHFGDLFFAGIDAINGVIVISSWEGDTEIQDTELAKRAKETGIRRIIYTNIQNEGDTEGPNIERTLAIAEAAGLPVFLSGGVRSMEDLEAISAFEEKGIKGVILDKAFYEGEIDIKEAVNRFQK